MVTNDVPTRHQVSMFMRPGLVKKWDNPDIANEMLTREEQREIDVAVRQAHVWLALARHDVRCTPKHVMNAWNTIAMYANQVRHDSWTRRFFSWLARKLEP